MTNNNLPLHYKPSFPNAQYQAEEAMCLKVFASILNVKMLKKRVNLRRELLRSGYVRFTLMYSKWCVKWWFPTQPVAESLFGMTFVVAPVATTKMNLYIHLEHLPAEVSRRSSAWADDNRYFASTHKLNLCSKIAMKRLSRVLSPLLSWNACNHTLSCFY